MKILDRIALVLVIIGGLNWGSIGFFGLDMVAALFGGSASGLSRLVREHCDGILSLPMFGKIGSLNASVAAGILLYEAIRQRMEGGM